MAASSVDRLSSLALSVAAIVLLLLLLVLLVFVDEGDAIEARRFLENVFTDK